MKSKFAFDDQIELTTQVSVTMHDADGQETVVSGYVSGRYYERPDIYDVTIPGRLNHRQETMVLHCIPVGRIKIIGRPKRDNTIVLAPYHSAPSKVA